MNRRQLFRNATVLAGAVAVDPKLLLEALPVAETAPAMIPISKLVTVNVTLSSVPWPTYEEILAGLLNDFALYYGEMLVTGTQDYTLVESVARASFDQQEVLRGTLSSVVLKASGL